MHPLTVSRACLFLLDQSRYSRSQVETPNAKCCGALFVASVANLKPARAVNLTRDVISAYVAKRRAMLVKRATGNKIIVNAKTVVERVEQPPSNGTINFELALLRRAFNIQVEARKLSRDHVPVMPMLEKSKPRQGFLDPAEFDALVAKLPEHLRDAVRFLYASGWRKNEAMTLEWRDVDFQNGVIRLRAEH